MTKQMTKLPVVNDSIPDALHCTTCLLPMQYQTKKDGKFLWQCFKCGKRFAVFENNSNLVEESWSPPK